MIYTEYEYIKYTEICKGASRIYVQGGLTKKFFLHHHLIQYLPNTDDNHIVTVRPKFYIGSTGTVWANETMFLTYKFPHLFEVKSNLNHVTESSAYSHLHDFLFLFCDMTEDKDLAKMSTKKSSNLYTCYEMRHLQHELQLF
jgi:hypothetical protein